MPGPAPKPPGVRRGRNPPRDGEWQRAPGVGWQHGRTPPCPSGVGAAAKRAWRTWFGSWMASNWSPEDLPMLEQLIRLYDVCSTGEGPHGELRQLSDRFGLSPVARQKLRWLPPAEVEDESAPEAPAPRVAMAERRQRLKVV